MPTVRGIPLISLISLNSLICCTAGLLPAQDTPKQLTARELFYAAADKGPSAPPARPPARNATRTPAKPVEIARVDPRPPRPRAEPQPPSTASPVTIAPVASAVTGPSTAAMPASGAPPLGLRYTVLKLGDDNTPTEVPNDTIFHTGDHIRFTVESNGPGYLYIVSQGSSGTWKPMFPSPELENGDNHIEGWRPYTMPPNARLTFDSTAGTENLFIVFSGKQEADLETMVYSLIYSLQNKKKGATAAPAPPTEAPVHSSKELLMAVNISNSDVDRMRAAYGRDLIIEKVNPATVGDKKETAVYVVNPSGAADARVVADLHLVHQ